MGSESNSVDPVAAVADDFIARYRRGERPAISEYTDRHPELAERIRQVIPLMVMMEEAGSGASPAPTVGAAGPGDSDQRPERIGGYRVLREVGRGGMGVVYEAEQLALGRRVALKVLRLHLAHHDSGLERFRREAKAAARLHHSNIVPVHEVGEDGDYYYYAMQFIQGQALDKVLEELKLLREAPSEGNGAHRPAQSPALSLLTDAYQGEEPLPRPAPSAAAQSSSVNLPGQTDRSAVELGRSAYHRGVARVGVQAAEALDYAHREGVIHRDIKPSNLLLDADGRVWVADFGLAQTDGAALTVTGDVVGTVRYMAPERFRGWSDPRSDVYSLGLTLYEMLLLRPAFAGADRISLIHQITHLEPPRLRQFDPRIPRDLETIVHKAMDKEPSRRYQTAAELAADLRRFVDDKPILARRISPLERTWRWGRRNPVVAGLIAAVVLITVVGVAATVWQMGVAEGNERTAKNNESKARDSEARAKDNEHKARDEADETKRANDHLLAARNALHHNLYISDMNSVQTAYEGDNLFRARELLDRYRPGPGETDERGFEWYYWQRQMHSELTSVQVSNGYEPTAISPDGSRLAVLDVANGSAKGPLVRIFDPATGAQELSLSREFVGDLRADGLQFSADGKRLVVFGRNTDPNKRRLRIVVWDLADRVVFTTCEINSSGLRWALSPDARRVAAADFELSGKGKLQSPGYRLRVWNCADGSEVFSAPLYPGGEWSCSLAFSSDGGRIATLQASIERDLLAYYTKRIGLMSSPFGQGPLLTAFTQTSGAASIQSAPRLQVLDASTGKELLADDVPFAYDPFNATLAFSLDGTRLLASGRSSDPSLGANDVGCIWNAGTGKQLFTLQGLPAESSQIALSADGRYVTWYNTRPHFGAATVQVRDLLSGKAVCTFKGHAGGLQGVSYSADGERLITMAGDGTVRTWRLPDASKRFSSKTVPSPDGTRIAYCNQQLNPAGGLNTHLEIQVHDNRTRKELLRVPDLIGSPTDLQFSEDGKRLALLLRVNDSPTPYFAHAEVKVWNIDTREVVFSRSVTAPPDQFSFPLQLCFRPDGRLIALSLLQGEKGKIDGAPKPLERAFAVKAWNVDSGAEAYSIDGVSSLSFLQFTPDSRRLIAVTGYIAKPGDSCTIEIWDAATGREQSRISTSQYLSRLTVSRDGAVIAACTKESPNAPIVSLKVWDADTGEERRSFPESVHDVGSIDLSPDGHFLAAAQYGSAGRDDNGFVKVWDLKTGEPVQALRGHNSPVICAIFSPDGRRLASVAMPGDPNARGAELRVWDVAAGRLMLNATLSADPSLFPVAPSPIRFSPSGDRLIISEQGESIEILDATPIDAPNPSGKGPRTIAGWGEIVDPSGDCTFQEENGKLTITVPGAVHDLNPNIYANDKGLSAPRVLQSVDGDFSLQVKASSAFSPGPVPAEAGNSAYNGAGLILWLDARSFIRVELAGFTSPTGETGFSAPEIEYWKDGKLDPSSTWHIHVPDRPSAYVRLERRGGEIRVGVSNDGQNWTYRATPINVDLPSSVRVGVHAINTSRQPFTVEFEELQLRRKAEEDFDKPKRSAK